MLFWQHCWKHFDKVSKVFDQRPKLIKKHISSSKNSLSSKCSYGHIECGFDNPADKSLTKSQDYIFSGRNMLKKHKILSMKFSPSNCSHGNVESSFQKPAEKILPESQNFFGTMSQTSEKKYISEKNFRPQKVPMDNAVYSTLLKVISSGRKNFCALSKF